MWKREAEVSMSEWCHVTQTWLAIAGFENEKKLRAKECGQFLESGKSKEISSTLKPPEVNQPYWYVDFSPVRADFWPLEL